MPQNTRNNSNNKIQFIYGRREPGSRSIKPLETSSYRGEKKKKKERSGQRKSDRRFLGRSRERKFLVGNYIICAKGTCIDNEILDRAPRCTSYDRKIPGNAETTEARKKEKKKRKMSATSCKTSYLLMMATVAEVVSREDCQDGHSLHARAPVCAASTKFPFNLVKTAPR